MIGQHDEFQADGDVVGREACGQADRRHPGLRGDQRVGGEAEDRPAAGVEFGAGRRQHPARREAEGVEALLGDDADDGALEGVAGRQLAVVVGIVGGLFWSTHDLVDQVKPLVVLAVTVDVVERMIGHGRPRQQEGVDVVARVGDVERRLDDEVHQVRQADLHDLGAGGLHGGDGTAHDGVHGRAVGILVAAEGLLEDADAGAGEGAGIEAGGVALLVAGDRVGGGVGVLLVIADDGVEQDGRVGDRPTHRPGGILEDHQRRHAGAANQARRDPDADEVAEARRQADRAARVLTDADGGQVGRDRRAGAGAGAAGIAGYVVGVAGVSAGRRRAEPRGGEVGQRGLAEDDGAGRLHLGDGGGVLLRHVALQRHRAEVRLDALRLGLVLHRDGDAVQRADERAGGGERFVEAGGLRDGRRIEGGEGVERRPGLVVGGDPGEIGLHQGDGGQRAVPVGRVDRGDRRLFELEGHVDTRRLGWQEATVAVTGRSARGASGRCRGRVPRR